MGGCGIDVFINQKKIVMEIRLTVKRDAVLDEVQRTTLYTGGKMTGDAGALERIGTVDDDRTELLRFFDECRAEVAQAFIRLLSDERMEGETYVLYLNVSVAFDKALLPGMELGLFSYFVQRIASKWYVYANKGEAGDYAAMGKSLLNEIKEKAFYKKQPQRPRYD